MKTVRLGARFAALGAESFDLFSDRAAAASERTADLLTVETIGESREGREPSQ